MTDAQPKWAVHPGRVLREVLHEKGMSQIELARRTAYTPKHISRIINGKARVTGESAIRFERVLGVSASFWLAMQGNYEIDQARRRRSRN